MPSNTRFSSVSKCTLLGVCSSTLVHDWFSFLVAPAQYVRESYSYSIRTLQAHKRKHRVESAWWTREYDTCRE